MAKKINIDKYASGLFTRTEQYADKVRQHYAVAVEELLKLTANGDMGSSGAFSFGDNTKLSSKANAVLRGLYSAVYGEIKNGVQSEWEYANLSCDALIQSVFGRGLKESNHFARWFSRNQEALDAFFVRKSANGGLNLSQRVWKYVGDLKTEMEVALSLSLGQGDSASTVSRRVRQFLQEPDKMFRRFRVKVGEEIIYDDNGEILERRPIYGKRWKRKVTDPQTGETRWENFNPRDYHPGRGVYRSSYKNAMRLTRTETNMAYRMGEQDRWQRMEFVVGYEVKCSRNHPMPDICDMLAGKYPKNFVFRGWHPQCRCQVFPILATDDEFVAMQQDILNGNEPRRHSSNEVVKLPQNFASWMEENAERIEEAEARGVAPFFIKDNQGKTFGRQKPIKTEEERKAIIDRWNARKKKHQLILKTGQNVLNVAHDYPEVDVTLLQQYIDTKSVGHIDAEMRAIAKQIAAIKKDEKALSALIPDVHAWKVQFTSSELHAVYDAVEKKLASWQHLTLEEQAKKLKYEAYDFLGGNMNGVQSKYATWQVSQAAYIKKLGEVNDAIDWQNINEVLAEAKTFKTKSQPYLDLISQLESAVAAHNKPGAQFIVSDMQAKRIELKKAADARARKRLKPTTVVFDDGDFTESRKKHATFCETKEEGEATYFYNAVETYAGATKEMKQAAESYTQCSGSITKMLRGMSGFYEKDQYYADKSLREINALTDMIQGRTFKSDMWVVRDERLDFTILKAGGFDIREIERQIMSYKAKITDKYRRKFGYLSTDLKEEVAQKAADYKAWRESKIVGQSGVDPSFLSTSSYRHARFSGTGGDNKYKMPKTHLEIYLPKGTQATYAAPFNFYNGKNIDSSGFWNGTSHAKYISEAEIILQRGGKYRILEARYEPLEDRWYIKAELVSQVYTEIEGHEYVPGEGYKVKFKR